MWPDPVNGDGICFFASTSRGFSVVDGEAVLPSIEERRKFLRDGAVLSNAGVPGNVSSTVSAALLGVDDDILLFLFLCERRSRSGVELMVKVVSKKEGSFFLAKRTERPQKPLACVR